MLPRIWWPTRPYSKEEEKMWKKAMILSTLVLFSFAVPSVLFAQEDVQKIPSCKYCGMDRAKFAHSRMLILYDDGTSVGTCSIHCVGVDLAINIDKTPQSIRVGDYYTKKLIPVEEAIWVIGGNKMGVMTKRAKWAFEKKEDAQKFMAENGGKTASFEESMKAAYEDMYTDTKMIRERRKMKRMQRK
jgi:copper chaperone NosL